MPKVSILMGVYNCANTIEKSIESILNQTFSDWEFIICDDCSKDNTLLIINEYASRDGRFVVIHNEKNRGLSYALNRCLQVAKGEYCARMDGDDLCDPTRLTKQVEFLENNPQFAFVSSTMTRFNENGVFFIGSNNSTVAPKKKDFIKGSPFCHAPVMIRKTAYEEVEGYRDIPRTRGVEDYDLWFRLYQRGLRGYILTEPLYSMFDGLEANKRRTWKRRMNEAWVRLNGYKLIKISPIYWVYAAKPLVLGLIPKRLYMTLRNRK